MDIDNKWKHKGGQGHYNKEGILDGTFEIRTRNSNIVPD